MWFCGKTFFFARKKNNSRNDDKKDCTHEKKLYSKIGNEFDIAILK